MNIRAIITTGNIRPHTSPLGTTYTCEMLIDGAHAGDLYRDSVQDLKSLCLAICSIPELTKANESYQNLKNMKHSLNSDFDTKSREVEQFNQEAHNKLNGE